jgi:glutamate-ammonia-ligase adenylyltransferase
MVDLLDERAFGADFDRCPDPEAARRALRTALDAQPDLAGRLTASNDLRAATVLVASVSRSLGRALASDPHALRSLADPAGLDAERTVAALRGSYADQPAEESSLDVATRLRRWKRRELMRIAARDLTGRADLPTVGRELAALAEVALQQALAGVPIDQPFAVIGMGKLGGNELNYSSDIDVIFIHEGPAETAHAIARQLLTLMTAASPDGIVFRTDTDLRPEGRSGPLSRSLESSAAYYEQHAVQWEFQALIKARPVAGDAALGERFIALVEPLVWPTALPSDAVREVRAMKARSEELMRSRGLEDRDLKRGRGGIRDIEFAVQLLQLVHGRHDTRLRSRTTLDALAALNELGYIDASDAYRLDAAYRDLRTWEHRLQLEEEQQTHTLPTDDDARTRIARACGYRDRGNRSALDQFDQQVRRTRAAVRVVHERLFFEPLLETLAGTGPLSIGAADERLAAFGFHDTDQTHAALRELVHGLTRRSVLMQRLLPAILGWLSETADPDLGLLQLRRLADSPARAGLVAGVFRESPAAAARTCRLLGSSRLIGDAMLRQPDFLNVLADDEQLMGARDRQQFVAEAVDSLAWRIDDVDARREGLRRFKRRQLLRVAARDLLGFADIEAVQTELSSLAEASVEAAVRVLNPAPALPAGGDHLPFAVIGMGRLGGAELSYASDIDVLFVYDGHGAAAFDQAEKLASRLMREIGAATGEGQTFRIDADLRPEGKQGPLARSLDSYRNYYEQWALPWEFQALTRARVIAGNVAVGTAFIEMVQQFVYRDVFPESDAREIRRIKARVERERIPTGEDPQFHLKLGRGSLSDIEFTVQLLQLRLGGREPSVRVPSTIGALHELRRVGALDADDADALVTSYRFCERARNARYLLTGAPGDALPTNPDEGARLAFLLGYLRRPNAALREDYRRVTRRARRVVERVFYGATPT